MCEKIRCLYQRQIYDLQVGLTRSKKALGNDVLVYVRFSSTLWIRIWPVN